MPSGSVILISPDGETEKRYPVDYAQQKIAEGWVPASGQKVGIETEYGKHYLPAEQGLAQLAPHAPLGGGGGVSAEEAQQDWMEEQRRQEYEGRGLEAAAAGAARGLTFGLSDVVLPGLGITDKDTLRGLQEFEPGMSTAGELGSILVGGVGALGRGAVARGLRATPMGAVSAKAAQYGAKGTKQFLGANAVEGALYGIGSGVSQVALSNEELAAETAVSDILKSGALGGIIGLGGGAAFKGTEKLWQAGKKLRVKPVAHLDIKTPEGAEFLGATANNLRSTMQEADDVFVATARQMTPKELYTVTARERVLHLHMDDALGRAKAARDAAAARTFEMPTPPKGYGEVATESAESIQKKLADLDEELAAAMTRDAPEDIAAFDKMVQRSEGAAADTSMVAGATQRKGREIAKFEREVAGKARGGVDEARLPQRKEGLGKGTQREISQIEDDILALKAQTDVPTPSEKAVAVYEKQVAAIEAQQAHNAQVISHFDEAMETVAKRKEHLLAGRKASKGSEAEKLAVALQGDASEISDDIIRLRSLLGDDPESLRVFAADSRKHVLAGNDIVERLRKPMAEGAEEARTAYQAAAKELKASMGDPTAENLHKLMNAEPEEFAKGMRSLIKYSDSISDMAAKSGDKALIRSTNESLEALGKQMSEGLPPEALAASREIDFAHLGEAAGLGELVGMVGLEAEDTPFDNIARAGLIYALLRGRRGLKPVGLTSAPKGGTAPSRTFLGRTASSGAGGSARSLVKGQGAIARGGKSAVSMAAYQAFGRVADKIAGARGLHQLNGRAGSQIVHAINKLAKKGGRQLMTGKSAAVTLKGAKWLDKQTEEAEAKEDELVALFEKRADQLRKLAHNPQRLQQDMWQATQELREMHPTWGDKVEVGLGNKLGYAFEKLPKNPGGHHMFGGDSWKPDEYQIQEFANILEVIANPMSAVEGVADGTLTPEAAEAFRATAPAMYKAVQAEIAGRVEELQDTLDYDEQNRLGMLMGVPVNVTTTPEYVQFIAQSYAQRKAEQAESMGTVDANALIQGVPTQAQQLLNRGTKR